MKEESKSFERLLLLLWLAPLFFAIIALGTHWLWRQNWSDILCILAFLFGGISLVTALVAVIGFRLKNKTQCITSLAVVSLIGIAANIFLGLISIVFYVDLWTQSKIQINNYSEIPSVTVFIRPGEWGDKTRSKQIKKGDSKTFWIDGSCEVQKMYNVEIHTNGFDTTLIIHCRGGTVTLFGRGPKVKAENFVKISK